MKNNIAYKKIPIIIVLISMFMGIAYASVNSIIVSINGYAEAKEVSKVFFTDAKYLSDNNANVEDSEILSAYKTILNSKVKLSKNDLNSSITYEITVFNNTEYKYKYDGTNYIFGKDEYSNNDIMFTINIDKGTLIESKDSLKFTITFSYKDGADLTKNELKSVINFKFVLAPYVVDTYDYVGNVEEFEAPHKGIYKLEVWGAQGGSYDETYYGGKGGYSYGNVLLEQNEKLYLVVGGQGTGGCVKTECIGGYNGGGNSGVSTSDELNFTSSGGGATHISYTNKGELYNYESAKEEILIVAGGGGGGYYHTAGVNVSNYGGAGGGLSGIDGKLAGIQQGSNGVVSNATGGTQESGGIAGYRGANGSFGKGGSGESCNSDTCGSSGGGGGYYGGGAAGHAGSGGGSGYIGGVIEGSTIAGIHEIATHDGTSQMIGNTGNGYAKITFLKEVDEGYVYISNIKHLSDNNVDETQSKIISIDKTQLISEIVLNNNDPSSSITYEVEILNTTNYIHYYDGVKYTLGENTYNNENITFTVDGLEEGYLLGPNQSIKFNLTFNYKNQNIINETLLSTLNFKFIKTYNISYIGFDNGVYKNYALENQPFTVTFNNSINEIKLKSDNNYIDISKYTFDGNTLTINNITNDVEIINVDNVQIIPDFDFSNGEYQINIGGYNVYRVNAKSTLYNNIELNGVYNISKMKYIEFDIFVPNGTEPKKLDGIESQIELGSGGYQDLNEISYGLSAAIYNNLVAGFWNHVVIPIDQFYNVEQDGYDLTKINYIGIYWNSSTGTNKYEIKNCKIKNFKFSNYIL